MTTHHEMMTYCSWGQLPADRPKYKGKLTHYNCICGCKEMVEEIKKIIDIREKLVRMGCSPGYIDGCNGNPGIWKTILLSGWEERTVKNCLKSVGLKNGKYREMDNGYETLYDIETAVKMKTRDDIKYLKKYEDHLEYHKNHPSTKSSSTAESLRRLLDMDKPQTQTPSPAKVCLPNLNQKAYHGASNHESKCADHTFWVYSPYLKLQNKWDTHLQVSTYCNNHIQHDANTYKCLGHTNPADFISAQKEWKQNGWTEEWTGLENLKEEANDEPKEMFVGKKSYISQ
jgi:hypothetical protein